MDELVRRLEAASDEAAELRSALVRTAASPVRPDARGRLAQVFDAAVAGQAAAWAGHVDGARRLERELSELAGGVRTAAAAYREVEQELGGVA